MKICTRCSEQKSLEEFGRAKGYKDGIRSECKKCYKARVSEWRKKNPEKWQSQWNRNNKARKERGYNWHLNNRERARSKHLKRAYGLTLEDYERMYQEQSGKCAACQESHETLDVDHCHETGRVRALLCNRCNRALGMANDNPELIKKLLVYITDR